MFEDVDALVATDAGVIVIATEVLIDVVVGALGDLCVLRIVVARLGLEATF